MFFEVVTDRLRWEQFFNCFPDEQKDIYFDYRYARAYEANGDGEANYAVFSGANGMKVLYPFLKVKIPDYGLASSYYDLTSCYGYGGPLVASYNDQDMEAFENLFHDWCADNQVIAEFIRFHPVLENHDKFKRNIKTELNRQTVCVDLSLSLQGIWEKSLTGKNRNQIKKAKKAGLTIREAQRLDTFVAIYHQTMQRVGADAYLYFSNRYFNQLSMLIPRNMVILEALFEERVIASAMFMFMGKGMHYHLAGSLREYLHLCPNNLLLYQSVEYGINKGLQFLHLGGGITDSEQDSLFKFKRSFSPDRKKFYIGRRVHRKDLYELLIKKWEETHGGKARLFLQYESA